MAKRLILVIASVLILGITGCAQASTPAPTPTPVPSTGQETGNRENEVTEGEVAGTSSSPEEVLFDSDDPTSLTDEQNQGLEDTPGASIYPQGEGDESNEGDGIGPDDDHSEYYQGEGDESNWDDGIGPDDDHSEHYQGEGDESNWGDGIGPDDDHSEHYQGEGDESNWDDGAGSVDIDFDANEYPRMYKDPIRGIWEPGAWDQLAIFVNDTSGQERLESLGINTISVVGSFDVLEDGEYEFPFTIAFIETEIVRYKKLGFAVFLSGNSKGAPSDVNPEHALENYLLSCKMAAIELAELAERYNVEYFSPNNEFEGSLADEGFPNRFQSYNPPETPFDPTDSGTDTRVEAASGWFKDILPELRQAFSGKIIAKVGEAHPGYMVEGYDYLAFTIDHHNLNESDFRRLVSKQYKDIADAAARSGVSWMVGEAYFHYGDEGIDLDASTKSFLKDMQQHYFDISLDEYLSFEHVPRPSGYIFIGYFMEGIEIKDSPSEAIIRDYFTLMN